MNIETKQQRSILIIDDERPVREAVTDILEIENIIVLSAANGKEGLQMYAENQSIIELIILDLSMPGMSGEETLKQLQMFDPDVKVILSSGYSESDITALVSKQNHIDFLAKPYKIDVLLAKVSEFLT